MNQTTSPAKISKLRRTSKFSNTNKQGPVRKTDINNYTLIWYWRQDLWGTLCCNVDIDRANFMVAFHETQQCSHWHCTWPHSFSLRDNASQKQCERNKCQAPICTHQWHLDNTNHDTKTITAFGDHPTEWNTADTVTPVEKFIKAASLLISHSMSTIIEKKIAIRVNNTIESPHSIETNTQIADFFVVTQEKPKFIKPLDKPVFSMIPKRKLIQIWEPTWMSYLERTNENSRKTHSGFRRPKVLAKLRIIPQYRHESWKVSWIER